MEIKNILSAIDAKIAESIKKGYFAKAMEKSYYCGKVEAYHEIKKLLQPEKEGINL